MLSSFKNKNLIVSLYSNYLIKYTLQSRLQKVAETYKQNVKLLLQHLHSNQSILCSN